MKPTILTCAVTGTFPTREHNPALPVTPAEIAGHFIFRVTHTAQTSHADLVLLIAGLAEVKLMDDPA